MKKATAIFIVTTTVYLLGTLSLNSVESALNIEVQRVQEDVEDMKAKRDGLNIAREDKIDFDSIVEIAKRNGYTLNYAIDSASAKNE